MCDLCNRPDRVKDDVTDLCCLGCAQDEPTHTAECDAQVGNRSEAATGAVTGKRGGDGLGPPHALHQGGA